MVVGIGAGAAPTVGDKDFVWKGSGDLFIKAW